MLDADSCYRAISARDARFDGQFFTAVKSTGVFCRPVCPARTPGRANCVFYRSAAAALEAGLRSAEAALKYIVFGGLSAGVMLYGISLLYGLTGTLDLVRMGGMATGGLVEQFQSSPVPVAIAIVLVLAGFAYKVSVVPFHFWTPDVYEGAPTPVTTFLAVGSKAAGIAALCPIRSLIQPIGSDIVRPPSMSCASSPAAPRACACW